MLKIQFQLPSDLFLHLKKRVLEDLKKKKTELGKKINVKITKRSPSHSQIEGVLEHFFDKNKKKVPEYITFTSLSSSTLSRAFSKKNDGYGVDIETLDLLIMYIEDSFQTSFI